MGAVVNTLFGTRQEGTENAARTEAREDTEERNGTSVYNKSTQYNTLHIIILLL